MPGGIVWLASYPKSGSTWTRILLQNLEAEADAAPADINRLSFGLVASARGWLDEELGLPTGEFTDDEIDRLRPFAYEWTAPKAGPPLFLKIHDAYRQVASGRPLIGAGLQRAIYIVRNPLDLALSYSNHLARPLDQAIAAMADPDHALAVSDVALRRQVRQILLTWSEHVRSWLDAPDLDLHVVRYESLQSHPAETLRGIARFLGWPQPETALHLAVKKSDFSELRQQESRVGFDERPPGMEQFFRSGRSGEWREQLTSAQAHRIVGDHAAMMARLGYLDASGRPT